MFANVMAIDVVSETRKFVRLLQVTGGGGGQGASLVLFPYPRYPRASRGGRWGFLREPTGHWWRF